MRSLIYIFIHVAFQGGDEESVECAVKMLETIGKIFDRDSAKDKEMANKTALYYQHLLEISKQVSNRVRFSIENLIELRAVRLSLFFLFLFGRCW